MSGYVEYDSNNSGGSWWLNDEQWRALEANGWEVQWFTNKPESGFMQPDENGRWLGALATKAILRDESITVAIARWESVTGEDATDLGCNCCGNPHTFISYNDDGKVGQIASPEAPIQGTMNIW